MNETMKKPLNDELNPEGFTICVPKDCKLVKLPDGLKSCKTHDCRDGWKLVGEAAIAHACRVHDKIYRQVLGLRNVDAVDVGFAILERETTIGKFLAIRVHVNQKKAPEELFRSGLASLTELRYLKEFLESPSDSDGGQKGDDEYCDNIKDLLLSQLRAELADLFPNKNEVRAQFARYPISGILKEDLSLFGNFKTEEAKIADETVVVDGKPVTLDDVRIAICGVPIDIINAQYSPSITHPGGDTDSGVFVEPALCSDELQDRELSLIGRGRVNPIVGGVSVGTTTGQAGTLSTIVWDRVDGSPCALGNWHVLAGTATAQVGQPTYQPALFDGGTEKDVVARLKRWHLGEKGDAAIAELSGNRDYASGEILGLWNPISDYLDPELNLEVRKWGRTSGYTRGFIDGIHLAINIDYGNGVFRTFTNQFHIAPLYIDEKVSQFGDSGSLVVASLRPLELQEKVETLQENVEKLLGWLRQSCSGEGEELCQLLEECSTPTADLATLIECIEKGLAKSDQPTPGKTQNDDPPDDDPPEVPCKLKKQIQAVLLGELERIGYRPSDGGQEMDWFNQLLKGNLESEGVLEALYDDAEEYRTQEEDQAIRNVNRVHYAVGMIFAGDTPGSPFGEFAVASGIQALAEELRFSLRPVFEPRSSFRPLRVRPDQLSRGRASRSGQALAPGDQGSDPRGEGQQPTPVSGQGGSGSSGGKGLV